MPGTVLDKLYMFGIFRKCPNIIIAISEKKDGAMKLSPENRERFLEKLGIDENLIIRSGLVHGSSVKIVSSHRAGELIKKADGLITADKDLFLTITVADCLPIFIYDPEKEIVGLIHGGWRNLAGNILASAIEKMANNFGSLPKDILAGIGPGISQCHFEVKKDLLREFEPFSQDILLKKPCFARLGRATVKTRGISPKASAPSEGREGKLFLDLKKIAKIQLTNLGIKEENIEISPECTFCLSGRYFSFRRDLSLRLSKGNVGKPRTLQTMMAVVGRK